MKNTDIAIIGAGSVGSTIAYALILQNIAQEIMLVDINEPRCKGEVLDLTDALSFSTASIIRSGTAEEVRNAKIIIIAAGTRQVPGQSRSDLLHMNKDVITSVLNSIMPIQKNAIIIMVTNPVDILALYTQHTTNLPFSNIIGSGTFLDSLRLRGILAQKLHIAEESIDAYILGEHGDSQFVAWSCSHIDGIPLTQFTELSQKEKETIAQTTRMRAYEIISCKGATYYGIAACVADICKNILFNQRRIMPISCFIEQFDVYLSMPAILTNSGIEKILFPPLNQQEQKKLMLSIQHIKTLVSKL